MQTLTQVYPAIKQVAAIKKKVEPIKTGLATKTFVIGFRLEVIRRLMWLNILWVALRVFKNPFTAFRKVKAFRQ
jgi:hypothetical protein